MDLSYTLFFSANGKAKNYILLLFLPLKLFRFVSVFFFFFVSWKKNLSSLTHRWHHNRPETSDDDAMHNSVFPRPFPKMTNSQICCKEISFSSPSALLRPLGDPDLRRLRHRHGGAPRGQVAHRRRRHPPDSDIWRWKDGQGRGRGRGGVHRRGLQGRVAPPLPPHPVRRMLHNQASRTFTKWFFFLSST